MIITKKYAQKLIHSGKAKIETELKPDNYGRIYIAITRYDVQRTDHFEN